MHPEVRKRFDQLAEDVKSSKERAEAAQAEAKAAEKAAKNLRDKKREQKVARIRKMTHDAVREVLEDARGNGGRSGSPQERYRDRMIANAPPEQARLLKRMRDESGAPRTPDLSEGRRGISDAIGGRGSLKEAAREGGEDDDGTIVEKRAGRGGRRGLSEAIHGEDDGSALATLRNRTGGGRGSLADAITGAGEE